MSPSRLSRALPGPLFAGLLLAGAGSAPAARGPGIAPGFGVTPGGLVWTVEPAARRLVLRDPSGSGRGSFPLAADEGHVLGVADDGARVTAPTSDGFRRRPARRGAGNAVEARYVFRFADGAVRTTAATAARRGSDPAFLGDSAWVVREEATGWAVARLAPDGETAVARVDGFAVRRAVGRPAPPRLSAGPAGPALLFRGPRGDAVVRLDRPSVLVVPDPLAACGESRPRLALPHEDGVLLVSVRTAPWEGEDGGGRPLAVAELFDDAGRLLESAPLGAFNEVFPLPDGGLLALDGREAARFDDRFEEVSRGVLPLEEGADPAAAERVVAQLQRLESLGTRATGADWAELALLPGAPLGRFAERARLDPDGALDRLSRAPDGGPEAVEAARALPFLLDLLRPAERAPVLSRLAATPAGAPAWLRRSAAFALLGASAEKAPGWALPAAAEAIAAGTAPEGLPLPDEAYTPELAELVTAVDRARIEKAVRERPELPDALLSGNLDEAFAGGISELRFHAPAGRFARSLLDCAAGPPSAAGVLALARVAEAALETAQSTADGRPGEGDGSGADPAAAARGALARTLLEARSSPDAGLRAGALALGPLAGLPIDAAAFRAEVLRKPYLEAFAFLGLVADRSLEPRAWQGLFLELFSRARASSPDPAACTLADGPFLSAEGESGSDRYCNLFAIVHFAALDLGGEEDPVLISRPRIELLRAFARSSAAPPELRLDLRLGRAMRGDATEEEVLELLGERDLAPVFRRIVLTRLPAASPRVASFLERELSAGRVAADEKGLFLDVLRRLDAAAADRVAADAWARGTVPSGGAEGAGAFASALSAERVRESESLRAALRRARAVPGADVDAAEALAKAGDPGAAGPLADALLESCPGCRSAADLSTLFGPLGPDGVDALARLAEATLPFVTSPLEALFDLAPERAEPLARARLEAALDGGCVPEPLLPVLFAHGVDPFLPVLGALEARGCDRARLRPGEPVAAGLARAAGTDGGRAAREALERATPTCRAAFAALLGIDLREGPPADR